MKKSKPGLFDSALLLSSRGDSRERKERGADPYTRLDEGDDLDDLDDAERARLQESIERGLGEMRAGLGRPADEVLAELRARQ